MTYPFDKGLKNMGKTSHQLKIMSAAKEIPITQVIKELVERAFKKLSKEKLEKAKEKIRKFRR